jgi:3-(3-hydroxy-phenyl)propionate hydroxylase
MNAQDEVDVAIVGLGPVGATLALLLGQVGVKTAALDKLDDIYPLPRAVGMDHEIMRVIQNLGLADAVTPFVVPYRPTEYRGVGGKVIARYESLPPPYPQGWAPSFVFNQPGFERALRTGLRTLPSVDMRLATTVEAIAPEGLGVELSLTNARGENERLTARYVVGCDGGPSLVRRSLGIPFESLDFDEPWLVVDVLVGEEALARLPQTIVQFCDPARPTTHVVGPGNHRRWEIMLLPGEVPEEMAREKTIWRLLAPWVAPSEGELWRAATYVFHALVASDWRRDRVFLAGDAAHMTPPFMAQGMCQGIRDAANLAWKLRLVLDGLAGDSLLNTYQQERKPHVRRTTETAKALGRVICELDPDKARARDFRMLAERGDPPRIEYRQDLIPPLADGALATEQGAPVGWRFPQPWVKTLSGDRRLDDFVGHGFRLFIAGQQLGEATPDCLPLLIGRIGGAVVVVGEAGVSERLDEGLFRVVETGALLGDWFGRHRIAAALVRPDHYVFATFRDLRGFDGLADLLVRQLSLLTAREDGGPGVDRVFSGV